MCFMLRIVLSMLHAVREISLETRAREKQWRSSVARRTPQQHVVVADGLYPRIPGGGYPGAGARMHRSAFSGLLTQQKLAPHLTSAGGAWMLFAMADTLSLLEDHGSMPCAAFGRSNNLHKFLTQNRIWKSLATASCRGSSASMSAFSTFCHSQCSLHNPKGPLSREGSMRRHQKRRLIGCKRFHTPSMQ